MAIYFHNNAPNPARIFAGFPREYRVFGSETWPGAGFHFLLYASVRRRNRLIREQMARGVGPSYGMTTRQVSRLRERVQERQGLRMTCRVAGSTAQRRTSDRLHGIRRMEQRPIFFIQNFTVFTEFNRFKKTAW